MSGARPDLPSTRKLWQADGSSIYLDQEGSCSEWCVHSHCAIHEGGLWCPTNLARNFPTPAPMRCLEIPKLLRAALDTPLPWRPGFLHGQPGRGKTWRAVRMLADPPGAKFISVLTYLSEMSELALADNDPRFRVAERIRTTGRLILDDLGRERLTESTSVKLFDLIDYRYSNGLSTLVTSNLLPGELAAAYGDALADRILGFGSVRELTGVSRRLTSANGAPVATR